jgi:hypothetical protein
LNNIHDSKQITDGDDVGPDSTSGTERQEMLKYLRGELYAMREEYAAILRRDSKLNEPYKQLEKVQ